jgi:hypothetical protein
MKAFLKSAAALGVLAVAMSAAPASAAWVYVGSWSVGDGPNWWDNPAVYTGQEAAALLFGGTATDYAISTAGSDVSLINFRAHVDGWGDSTYLFTGGADVAQDYSLDTGGSGYNSNPGFGTAYSAYVRDHSYAGQSNTLNYAFRWENSGGVPEPATWAMMIMGFGLVGFAARRRGIAATA